jgi:hypothetical protein
MQADVSARIAALHDHISSVSSTHNLAAGSARDDHVTDHVTSTVDAEEEKKGVCLNIPLTVLVMIIFMLAYECTYM